VIVRSAGNLYRGTLDGGIWNDELAGPPKGSNLMGIVYQIRPLYIARWNLESTGSWHHIRYMVSGWDQHSPRLTNFSVYDQTMHPMQLECNGLGWTLNGLWIAFDITSTFSIIWRFGVSCL